MRDENPLRQEKRKKLHQLKEQGIDPFPHSFERTHTIEQLRATFSGIETGQRSDPQVRIQIAGRLMAHRQMGKASFINIQDQSGFLQIYVRPEEMGPSDKTSFQFVDIGDFVGIDGDMFRTKTGELSLHAKSFKILCKGLEPLPEKFHGIADIEIKYRHRHLDLVMSPESRAVFEMRSKIIKAVRNFLDSRGFLEVETPIMQPLYGGASARPFTTHHHALDMKLYLKISPELYLKRLIVGGFEKVYDLNKNFRNEGIDRSHNPEFTMVEWYEAYTDYNYQMKQFEDCVADVALKVRGTTKLTYQGQEIDFTPPWTRLTMVQAIQKYASISVHEMSDEQLLKFAEEKGVFHAMGKPSRGELIASIFAETCEKHLWQPTFILDHPVETSPLTKMHRTEKGFVERFEPFAAGMEIGNAYTELNDPEDQRRRLEEQDGKRKVDDEAQPMDEDFLHAIELGMPPTGGVGLGIERIVMILTDQHSLRDTILFPTMKIKDADHQETSTKV